MPVDDRIVLNSLSAVRRIEDEFTRILEGTMRTLERQITPLLDQYRVIGAVDTALARQQLESALMNSGYFEQTGRLLNEGYQAAIDEAQDLYLQSIGENFQFAEVSLERLNSLKSLDLGEFTKLGDDFATTMTRTLTDLNFGAVDFNQAVQTLQDNIDTMGNHAKTWVTTGLSGVYRESSLMLAEDNGMTEFIYKGPLDKITRDFCRSILTGSKKLYTKEEIDNLNNGQIGSVSQFGGGFNCRHQWIGVK